MLAMCALPPAVAGAATLSVDDAKEIAAEFFQSGDVLRLADKDALVLAYTATDEASNPVSYVFNAKDGKGCVIVSANDSSLPVIGYSYESIWDVNSVPEYAKRVIREQVKVPADTRRRVLARASGKQTKKELETPIWSQEAPFNNNIPNRRLTGCVGVALAEILKYHNYPASRPASLVKEGESTTYDWANMRMDNYRSGFSEVEGAAVATLVADAAIGIGTDFGMSSSSAYEVKVPYALTSLFGYDAGVSYKKRQEMSRDAWDQVIVDEIDADRPVLYCGQDVSAGHAFVCDGYELRGGSTAYFHINWGWGGSANNIYYASDALNPTVSRTHHYNDLMTIVYNIKPATDNTVWSDIHVTSDGAQVGLTLDVTDITSASSFQVRAGALKNISNTDFSGKLSVALFGADGKMKCLLNDGRNFNLIALQIMSYIDFLCSVPAGTAVADGDVVRLVAQSAFSTEWLPVSGDGLAPGEAKAKNNEIPYFSISLPSSSEDAEVSAADNKVIKGRDYTFTVVPKSADKVITVKANGFILTADANNGYRLSNVLENQKVDILVQNASDVLEKKTVWVNAGELQNLITEQEAATVKDLTLFGTINVNDFNYMRDRMKLERLDISQVSIVANGSNPANAIPTKAFMNLRSLKQIILPNNLTTFKNGCLAQTGLTSIEVPASVATWEYNVFVGCNQLKEVIVRRSTPAWINWCVFNGTPKTKLVVPVGASGAYGTKEYWEEFKEIVEENPVPATHFSVKVAEQKGVKFNALTDGTDFEKGAKYNFSAETDDSFGDATMQVYANTTRILPDASGNYTATVNANTLIHFEFAYPEPTTVDNAWKLTGAEGGVGLVTEVVNVPFGQPFTVRANAIKVPNGAEASKFYAIALTDKNGAIKEFISPILTNYSTNSGNLTFDFSCQVKDATIKEGNELRLVTSYNKKSWTVVNADADGVTDRIKAIGNQVAYHTVSMPLSITGATIQGAVSEIVRGMPLNLKVTPNSPVQRVTIAVNGVNKVVSAAVGNLSIPSVTEDLEITVIVQDAGASDYVVVNVKEGELATKIAECPARLKVMGAILVDELAAFRAHANQIIDLDIADMTIKGGGMNGNSIPTSAFAPTQAGVTSVLRSIILPSNLERISDNAFARCGALQEVTIPASVTYVGTGAFSACNNLKKITMLGGTPPATGTMSPFPSNTSGITLEVPRGYGNNYTTGFWGGLSTNTQKYYYWIKYDPTRAFIYNTNNYGDGSKIEVANSLVQVALGLPNCPTLSKSAAVYRKGVIYRIFDNDHEITSGFEVSGMNYGGQIYLSGGQYNVKFDPTISPAYTAYPKNHTIDVVFYYPITVEKLEGAEDVKSEIIVGEGGESYNATLSKYEFGASGTKLVYKEGKDYKVKLTNDNPNVNLTVKIVNQIMTKPGENPTYETVEFEAYPDVDNCYTIPALPGDTWVKVSGSVSVVEGEPISADILSAVSKEEVEDFTELTLEGTVEEKAFETIREKFEALETLDLTSIQNESLPENAFEGMTQLKDVIVSDKVTEIGAGCFKDCSGIESLTLPNVTTIGEGAFEGCGNLTSILLPSLGSTTPSGKPGMRKAGAVDGVSAESFKGLNPNCLIYVGAAEIPDAESLNVILNQGGQRVAASDIVLDGKHSFNAPASFMLGEHKISFTTEIIASDSCDVDGGWKTIILPFQPTEMKLGIDLDNIADREGKGINLISFDSEDAEVMTNQTSLKPNRPYLANVCAPFASVPVTFTASARVQEGEDIVYDVPFTPVPEELVAAGKEFSLYGSYDGQTRPVVCYALNEDASKFVRPEDSENVEIAPFSAYLVANDGTAKTEMAIGDHPLWVREPASTNIGGTKLYRSDKIELATPTKNASIYYTLDGTEPTDEATRKLYTGPFALEGGNGDIKAIAERKGYVSEPVEFNFELKKANVDFNLQGDWNWISHFAESEIAVEDFATEGIDGILSMTEEVVRDPKHGLVGALQELAPAQGYKVYIDGDAWTGNISGIAFDPIATIKLHKGWNWIGTPVDEGSLKIEDLFASLEVEEGDMLVGLDGFVQVDADGAWKGSVSHMVPGTGYMFFSNSDKEFVYNIVAASDVVAPAKAPVVANDGLWTVDNHKFASVMPMIASLDMAGDVDDYQVAAFCGNECRGIGAIVDGVVMINIHGNEGDAISFRFIGNDEEEMISTTGIVFKEKPEGTFANPFMIAISDATAVSTVNVDEFGVAYENGNFIFNGDMTDVMGVEIYDLTGKLIAKTTGARTFKVGNIDGSVVTIVIRKVDSTSTVKVVVK